MYLHLGQDIVVKTSQIIGIFDIENTSISKYTKDFLFYATNNHQVHNVSYEMPKSFIVCKTDTGQKLYISHISSRTLLKRAKIDMSNL